MNYKKILASGALMSTLMMPVSMFADTATTTPANPPTIRGAFCTNIDTYVLKLDQSFGTKQSTIEARRTAQTQKVTEAQANKDSQSEQNRAKWDANRDTQFQKLAKKAKTDAQKTAVDTFKTTVTAAIKARRDTVDQAIATYRTGLTSVVSARGTLVDTALQTLKTSYDTAIAKAKSDCASGVAGSAVKATLLASLKTARTTFSTSIKDTTQMKTDLKSLADARKVSFAQAQADFKTAYDKAYADLKTAFAK